MKKLVRNFSLFFKSLSIHLETRRLKREIKNAYSDKPSSFQWKGLVYGGLAFFLILGGFFAYQSTVGKKSKANSIPALHSQQEEDAKEKTIQDSILSNVRKDSLKHTDTTLVKDSRQHKEQRTNLLASKDVSLLDKDKKLDSNIIKQSYPALKGKDGLMKYLLVADKGDRIIHLFTRQGSDWFLARTFPVASGAKSGKKMVRGDLRTPEGIYFIEGRKEGDSLNRIYGPLAYVLNYPNRHDIAAGRTGNGIWIHGTTPGEVPVDTKGCLELHNDNLIKLSNILGKGDMIPVIIHSKEGAPFDEVVDLVKVWDERDYILNERHKKIVEAERADSIVKAKAALVDSIAKAKVAFADSLKQAQLAELDSLKGAVTSWAALWETMQIDSYSQAYDTISFAVPGYDWKKWKEKKEGTFNRYKSIDIKVSRISPKLLTDSTAVIVFRQVYTSDRFSAVDKKRLSMKKIASKWKITAEVSLP